MNGVLSESDAETRVSASAMDDTMGDVTRILYALKVGDEHAADRLLAAVYDELRRLAAAKLARERPGQTLQATALVHEAYLRILGGAGGDFDSRGHFFAAAAEAMRRILVERARRRNRIKHGGGRKQVELNEADYITEPDSTDLLALDEALDRLAAEDPVKADLVKLRYFAGLTVEEAGECLGVSRATADRYWRFARAWLFDAINSGGAQRPATDA